MICAVGVGLIHTARTQLLLVARIARQRPAERSNPAIVYTMVTAAGLLLASWLGGLGPGPAQFIVPPLEEFFNALWTTAAVVAVAAFIVRVTSFRANINEAAERSRREIGDYLLGIARQNAVDCGTDVQLVEAILLCENLQRPAWFRRLERLKGRIWPAGTYGPMQVWSPTLLSDEESIRKAVQDHLPGVQVPKNNYGGHDDGELQRILRRYNRDPNFVSLAADIYRVLTHKALI